MSSEEAITSCGETTVPSVLAFFRSLWSLKYSLFRALPSSCLDRTSQT
ncbi:hypothetical protein DsansV1_C08g0082481 [Dioscorea sansibarensis]